MLIQELMDLNESIIKAFGPKFDGKSRFPQFALDKNTAAAIADYTHEGDDTVYPVRLTLQKSAKNEDVKKVLEELSISLEHGVYESYTLAQIVSTVSKVREALAKMGFDSYADHSVLENSEPMQFVVFSESQAKYKE